MIRVVLALLLAGPVAAQELLEAYPPLMGEVSALLDMQELRWQTYDFSIGAFDASAWATDDAGPVTLRIMGYQPGKPDRMEQRIWIKASFAGMPAPKSKAVEALVEVIAGADTEGARLTSMGQNAVVTIMAVKRAGDETYGQMAGKFSARLCWKPDAEQPVTDRCQTISGDFDTSVQFENM